MPSWFIEAGYYYGGTQSNGVTDYYFSYGKYTGSLTEVRMQAVARDNYTWDRLYVRVVANTLDGATTVRSRDNGVNGNQTVAIGAGATGVFEDNVNSDNLASGDGYDTQVVAGGTTGNLRISILAHRLSTATNTTPVMGQTCYGSSLYGTFTWYAAIIGNEWEVTSESDAQLTFRVSATLSNMRIYVYSNNTNGASTMRLRVNGGNGNQIITIGAGATGAFEDLVNTDNIVPGDEVNYRMDAGGLNTQRILPTYTSIKSNSDGRQSGGSDPMTTTELQYGMTRYLPIECNTGEFGTVEADCQSEARTSLEARNMFVNIPTNGINGNIVLTLRQNGANSALTVTVGAGLTGFFEDLVNTVNFLSTDLINWIVVAAGSSGWAHLSVISFEQRQYAPAPPTGAPSGGIANKLIAERII